MGDLKDIATIARWEVKKSFSVMGRNVLPLAIVLFVLLVLVTGFTTQSGLHLQDGMYEVGVNDPALAGLIAGDPRFSVYQISAASPDWRGNSFDLIVINGEVFYRGTEKSKSALKTLERNYGKYVNSVYNAEEDLFAAYPLWIDVQPQKSELDFLATQSGQSITAAPGRQAPVPEGPVAEIPTPSPTLAFTRDELRQELTKTSSANPQISRYTEILTTDNAMGNFKTPSQMSPPLPFDSIILIFVFIFPLYFTSQFFMMSIMNERIERKGEILLSMPVKTGSIILGKMLPYFLGMLAICTGLTVWIGAPFIILLPLVPVIFFFLANALIIGMLSRSFKELSFISIFFSTVATSYLFFPSIFANVHVISFISPLTLIVLSLQGTAWTATDYLYSTSLFWLTSAVIFFVAARNFKEERLFSEKNLVTRMREFLSEVLSRKRPFLSLFLLTGFSIPFIFMVQMMCLVLFFNLPMPYSLVLLLLFAALIEEIAKGIGIYTIYARDAAFFTWKNVVYACAATAIGFLVGEKLLLFVTLAQITESVFGSILFLSLGVLWMPLLLHFAGVLIVTACLKLGGRGWFAPGLALAMVVHCLYNLYFILGWLS
ncbi:MULTISPECIES: ABC transporter permease [unclassified Methanoregula]|uniref:ABC transporter permease n=1 Tax=unclassified Methanoregula TaxID=2649730 RepID=UPI0009C91C14|nr:MULTISPECIES: ABC transporter permease [unclassified Methanoregula]OPX64141.1 MAG: ABC-2 family transporter protein [Methanoregula sp. PtaB.Bin085]OPY34739.1 MAG: ABC-2 family transporter protein [Methanoregula sp. PtaU1.Bin006]